MKNNNKNYVPDVKNQSGFTMIEIMVALVLGVGILTAAITMQVQHRKGFKLTSNKLEMQTNAKLAFEFISTGLRSIGSMGCKTSKQLLDGGDPKKVNKNGCYSYVCIDFNDPTIANADFRPGREILGYEYTGANLSPLPPTAFPFVALGHYNKGSDALTISGGYGEVYKLQNAKDLTAVSTGFDLDEAGISKFRLKVGQYAMLTSCRGAKVFKVTSFNNTTGVGTWAGGAGADENKTSQIGAFYNYLGNRISSKIELRRAAVTTFFVGMNPLGDVKGVPSLYQDIDGVSKLMVQGVEEIQFLYGLNESDEQRNTADRYLTADQIAALTLSSNENKWEEVVSVRIGIIMRSKTEVYSADITQSDISLPCIDAPADPFYYKMAPKTDRFARTSYCAEVSLRNRLTGPRLGKKT